MKKLRFCFAIMLVALIVSASTYQQVYWYINGALNRSNVVVSFLWWFLQLWLALCLGWAIIKPREN